MTKYILEYQTLEKRLSQKQIFDAMSHQFIILQDWLLLKLTCYDLCDKKLLWGKGTSDLLKIKFKKYLEDITNNKREIPKPKVIPLTKELVTTIDLHAFGTTSITANCAAVLAIVYQPTEIDWSLLESKSRIFKRNVTFSRLKLASAHAASNLYPI